MIPLPPFEPDKGPFSAVSTEVATNVLPTSVGWGPMPQLSDLSSALAAQCYGAWWYRNTTGSFGFIAATKTIDFDCLLDQAYSFRFRFRQKFALSDSATTNWLLTNHPDVYLAGVLIWGGVFTQNSQFSATFSAILETGIPSVKSAIAQSKRGVATVDPALSAIGWRPIYDGQFQ